MTSLHAFKIRYKNGDYEIVAANSSLEVIRKYDLATAKHMKTRVERLTGIQEQIALEQWNSRRF